MNSHASTIAAGSARPIAASLAPHAHWLLRVGFASVFLFHGIGKLAGPSQFTEMMQLPLFIALLVALVEVVGGVAVLAGGVLNSEWMTRLGGLVTIPVLMGAIAMVHWGQWSFVATDSHPMGGMEFQVVLLLLALYFALHGNGEHSA